MAAKTYEQLVAVRDKAAGDVQGSMVTDMAPDRVQAVLDWSADVVACREQDGLWAFGATRPVEVPIKVAGALITAQAMVLGHKPTAPVVRAKQRCYKGNKSGGWFAACSGAYSVNLPGGFGVFYRMVLDLPHIQGAMREALKTGTVTTERIPVGTKAHVYQDVMVLTRPDWTAPMPLCHEDEYDALIEWLHADVPDPDAE